MVSPRHDDFAEGNLARVIDRVTLAHDSIMEKLAGLVVRVGGVSETRRGLPVLVDDRTAPPMTLAR
jgi:hypothetical protein